MSEGRNPEKERPLIVVGPDGNSLRIQVSYQDPGQWKTVETKNAVLLMARPDAAARKKDLMAQINDYLDVHLTEKVTLKTMADHLDVSVSTITQMFQRKYGTTFHQYLTRRRMELAMQLIQAGTPLEEAGRRAGYTDHSTFYRAFRQSFGVSPREYRKKITE